MKKKKIKFLKKYLDIYIFYPIVGIIALIGGLTIENARISRVGMFLFFIALITFLVINVSILSAQKKKDKLRFIATIVILGLMLSGFITVLFY